MIDKTLLPRCFSGMIEKLRDMNGIWMPWNLMQDGSRLDPPFEQKVIIVALQNLDASVVRILDSQYGDEFTRYAFIKPPVMGEGGIYIDVLEKCFLASWIPLACS